MIDPSITSTVRVGQLPKMLFSLTDQIPHEVGTELKRGSIQDLADSIKDYINTSAGVAFNPTVVNNGGTLPITTKTEWMLVGKGTFHNVGGMPDIITNEELNALTSNGLYWSISVEISLDSFIMDQTIYSSSIANLRSHRGVIGKNIYTTDKDQEGNWYYDPLDTTSVDNTGTVLVTSDGKRIKRVFADFVKPEWFGAKGDGVTDDLIAIQAALNDHGDIIFENNNYIISDDLIVGLPGEIKGIGNATLTQSTWGLAGFKVVSDNVKINNLSIINSGTMSTSYPRIRSNCSGAWVLANNIKLNNLTIDNFTNSIFLGSDTGFDQYITDIEVKDIIMPKTVFGVLVRRVKNVKIQNISGSYYGLHSSDPPHIVYITGDPNNPSHNIIIDNVVGYENLGGSQNGTILSLKRTYGMKVSNIYCHKEAPVWFQELQDCAIDNVVVYNYIKRSITYDIQFTSNAGNVIPNCDNIRLSNFTINGDWFNIYAESGTGKISLSNFEINLTGVGYSGGTIVNLSQASSSFVSQMVLIANNFASSTIGMELRNSVAQDIYVRGFYRLTFIDSNVAMNTGLIDPLCSVIFRKISGSPVYSDVSRVTSSALPDYIISATTIRSIYSPKGSGFKRYAPVSNTTASGVINFKIELNSSYFDGASFELPTGYIIEYMIDNDSAQDLIIGYTGFASIITSPNDSSSAPSLKKTKIILEKTSVGWVSSVKVLN